MSKVTACMIAKNERANIRPCILTLIGKVQEIVFVDTGSTDGTYESAKSLAEKKPEHIFKEFCDTPMRVEQIEWEGFDHARNRSIDFASNDWVFIIDLDERLLTGHNLADIVIASQEKPGITFILGDIYNVLSGGKESIVRQCRLFDRRMVRYIEDPARKIHNQLEVKGRGPSKAYYGIRHFGYTSQVMDAKYDERKRMLEEWLGKEPNNYQAIFYYARHIIRKDPIKADLLLHQVIENPSIPDHLRPSIYSNLYESAVSRKASWQELIGLAKRGGEMFPHHPDAYWILAWGYSTAPSLIEREWVDNLARSVFYGVKYLEKANNFSEIARPGEESRFSRNQNKARDLILGSALKLGYRELAHQMVDQIIATKEVKPCPPAKSDDSMFSAIGIKDNEDGVQEIQVGKA